MPAKRMPKRLGGLLFACAVGVAVAALSYRWITDAAPRAERSARERLEQETAVLASRDLLQQVLDIGALQLVDPLAPDRVVGKSYVYPDNQGWQVSGFYRRSASDLWHPYLLSMDTSLHLVHLKISDTALLARSGQDSRLEILP